jgi:hypothetical protein
MDMNVNLYIWLYEHSRREIRTNIPYSHAYQLASKGDYYKCQIIDPGFDTILMETRIPLSEA